MTALQKYKNIIAIIFLAAYTFIATPVQCWHQHNYGAATSLSSLQSHIKTKITTPDSSNKTIEDNCQVCAHHYSIYFNDAAPVFKIFISSVHPKEGFYALSISLAPYFSSTNKGPPSVA